MENELVIWVDIPTHLGYQCTRDGLFKSLDRFVGAQRNRKRLIKGQILSTSVNSSGYYQISFGLKTYMVHRLLAITFISNPNKLPCVNHIDGNKLNNTINNLEWTTYSDNMIHAAKTNLTKHGEEHCNAVLSNTQIAEIRRTYVKGEITHKELAKKYKVTRVSIGQILNNKTRVLETII